MNDIKITVLITTYNCGEFILPAIKSILNQTYQNFELLVIDDGSTDNTENNIRTLSNTKIKFIKLGHIGRSKALNFGLREAKNDWVALMDADDICHPQRLERQIKNLSSNQNTISVTWSAYFTDSKILYTIKTPVENSELIKRMLLHSYICNSSVLYNRNYILENGGYREDLTRFEDYDLWLRILLRSSFVVIPEILLFVRYRVISSSNENKIFTRKMIYEIQKPHYRNIYKYYSFDNPDDTFYLKGWREFFYGNQNRARSEWKNIIFKRKDFRMVLAFILTYFPAHFLNKIRELRIKLRINYFIEQIGVSDKLRFDFKSVIHKINVDKC